MIPMPRYTLQLALGATIVAGGSLWWHDRNNRLIEAGRLQERVRVLDSTLRNYRHQERKIDSVFRIDTLTLTKTIVKYATRRDTVERILRNTAIRWDTTVVYRYIHQADTTIRTCLQALRDCNNLAENRKQQIQALELKVQAQVPPHSSLLGNVLWGGIAGAGGYLLGRSHK